MTDKDSSDAGTDNFEVDSVFDDNMITYDEYQIDSGVKAVPTVVSADKADKQSMIAVLQHMHTEIAGYVKVNDEHKLVNATLTAKLEWCKIELQALKRNKFVPQKELSQELVYWLPAAKIVSQSSTPTKPVAPFVHTRPVKSDVHKKVWKIKECITTFEKIIKERTAPPPSILSSHRCYEELSKANTYLRTTSLEKIAAQKAKIATLNAKTVGNKTSGTTKPANPKVIAPGMYAISPKYIVPQRRTYRETPIPLPKKKQVTFQETPKPLPRFTKKPVAPLLKKPNVNVPLST
uniref:Uncharacterized protein n=1 Tax=Tanacetum cinerariifolium TaxID=118510 RepID=A0A6L2KG98_TANCI|nr:hypothetical protein [Tanacetum cinerariifolium]